MAKKKKNRKAQAKTKSNKKPPQPPIVVKWESYMGENALEDWKRLMKDLGFSEEFPSKTRCRKALKTVWVNIPDFLLAIEKGEPVHFFRDQFELARYTRKECRYYPKNSISKGSPLRQLLAHISTKQGEARGDQELITQMDQMKITEPHESDPPEVQ
ncbi:hypothetical protein F5Y19DRAFT_362561 [Xylariaceae sp. FL1651]|nr:hypothetical protein F5Y19DRAFT_362561 [Xylariaceae sp. FL1651]